MTKLKSNESSPVSVLRISVLMTNGPTWKSEQRVKTDVQQGIDTISILCIWIF